MIRTSIATRVAWSFIGTPYLWGGDDPMKGFDCSGFCIEILKSVGILPRKGDWTAQMLRDKFKNQVTKYPQEGCLVFWQNGSGKIVHMEYCLNSELSIGASGGGSTTTDEVTASKQNAYIKVRPFRSRSGLWGFVDPFTLT